MPAAVPHPDIAEKRRAMALRKMRMYEPDRWQRRLARLDAAERAVAERLAARKAHRPAPTPKALKAVDLPVLKPWEEYRLWSKVQKGEPDQCWPWTAAKSNFGHGRFKVDGKLYLPHRLIYALTKGPITNAEEHHGTVVMHSCDNPACCNPAHLSLGRQVDNVADMAAKGRSRSPFIRPASAPSTAERA